MNLPETLLRHVQWWRGDPAGERANLAGADLAGADLTRVNLAGASLTRAYFTGANLAGATLDGEILKYAPIQIFALRWPVLITPGFMRIGCQRHSHEAWSCFSETRISAMDPDASGFWACWREPLLAICAAERSR